jgi:hypothetical protein
MAAGGDASVLSASLTKTKEAMTGLEAVKAELTKTPTPADWEKLVG